MARWLSLWLIHYRSRRFTGDRGPAVRTGHERWRTVRNAQAQYSKACEGASLPWVQIPPPPPLTCTNTGPDGRRAHASCRSGLIYWSQLRATCGPPAGISSGCCAWSPRRRTGLNAGERRCARPRGVRPAVQGWPGRSATGRRPANSPTAHNDRSRSSRRTRAEPPSRVETSVAAGRAFGADLDDRQGPPAGAWIVLSSKAAGSGPGAPRVPGR